jgi:hypothetical protein
MVANTLLLPVTNLPEGYQQPMAHCNRVAPIAHKKGNLCTIPLKKVTFKVKNQEEINSYKNYQRFIFK